MRYLSIDLETTGLDPKTCDILEIGAYLEDTDDVHTRDQLPCFHRYIWRESYRGDPYALAMNGHIFKKILELKKTNDPLLIVPDLLTDHFLQFMVDYRGYWPSHSQPMVIAGKNVSGFDLRFLDQMPRWAAMTRFHHRVIDPGMMYFDPRNDQVPPDLKECKKRANLPEHVSHEALDDAWDVIQLVRAKFSLI